MVRENRKLEMIGTYALIPLNLTVKKFTVYILEKITFTH